MSVSALKDVVPAPRDLTRRVSVLERKVEQIADIQKTQGETLVTVVANTDEILAVVTGAKNAATFLGRHYKTILKFGAGFMTAIGMGNPKLWDFITNFNWS
jgi:hypothetical protein